jgi:hypothetical protein
MKRKLPRYDIFVVLIDEFPIARTPTKAIKPPMTILAMRMDMMFIFFHYRLKVNVTNLCD